MASLTHEEFARNLNTIFRIQLDDTEGVDLELTSVSEHLVSEHQERFSVVFRGPNEKFLGQGIRQMQHDDLQNIDLFIVPIRRDEAGTYYEAVFNRVRSENQGKSTA